MGSPVAVALPRFYAITESLVPDDPYKPILEQASGQTWLRRFRRLAEGDVCLIQLRVKHLASDHLDEIIDACLELSSSTGKRLLLNGSADTASQKSLAGVHLTSSALLGSETRPLAEPFMVGASCHSPGELQKAERIGCDFACLSPVKPTGSYDAGHILGLDRFSRWVSQCSIPVFGLGGLAREDLGEIMNAGGQGVAGISAFW